jgi:hypothetical protein
MNLATVVWTLLVFVRKEIAFDLKMAIFRALGARLNVVQRVFFLLYHNLLRFGIIEFRCSSLKVNEDKLMQYQP